MGDVTGPISTLPGRRHELPEGTMCDVHPDRAAVVRVQGETDSFGCEMYDCCQECFDEIREYERSDEAKTGKCDWCKKDSADLADEFAFRLNDGRVQRHTLERLESFVSGTKGKRLTYKALIQ